MNKVAIVTDSTVAIPPSIAEQQKLHQKLSIETEQLLMQLCELQGEMNATGFYQSRFVWGIQDP